MTKVARTSVQSLPRKVEPRARQSIPGVRSSTSTTKRSRYWKPVCLGHPIQCCCLGSRGTEQHPNPHTTASLLPFALSTFATSPGFATLVATSARLTATSFPFGFSLTLLGQSPLTLFCPCFCPPTLDLIATTFTVGCGESKVSDTCFSIRSPTVPNLQTIVKVRGLRSPSRPNSGSTRTTPPRLPHAKPQSIHDLALLPPKQLFIPWWRFLWHPKAAATSSANTFPAWAPTIFSADASSPKDP